MQMRVEYNLTVDDHIAKLDRFIRHSSVSKGFTWAAYFTIVGLAWLSTILFYVKQGQQNYVYMVAGGFALALTITLPSLYRWYQNSFWASVFTPQSVLGIVGKKVLILHDEYVEEQGEKSSLRLNWRDMQAIESDASRTWLIFAPFIVVVIPGSAFESSTAYDAFMHECEQHMHVCKLNL